MGTNDTLDNGRANKVNANLEGSNIRLNLRGIKGEGDNNSAIDLRSVKLDHGDFAKGAGGNTPLTHNGPESWGRGQPHSFTDAEAG